MYNQSSRSPHPYLESRTLVVAWGSPVRVPIRVPRPPFSYSRIFFFFGSRHGESQADRQTVSQAVSRTNGWHVARFWFVWFGSSLCALLSPADAMLARDR